MDPPCATRSAIVELHLVPLDPLLQSSTSRRHAQASRHIGWLRPPDDARGRGRQAAALPETKAEEQRRCRGRRETGREGRWRVKKLGEREEMEVNG
jgi:hypothetical protein